MILNSFKCLLWKELRVQQNNESNEITYKQNFTITAFVLSQKFAQKQTVKFFGIINFEPHQKPEFFWMWTDSWKLYNTKKCFWEIKLTSLKNTKIRIFVLLGLSLKKIIMSMKSIVWVSDFISISNAKFNKYFFL